MLRPGDVTVKPYAQISRQAAGNQNHQGVCYNALGLVIHAYERRESGSETVL
jgi:hypothetical protein